MYSTTEYNDEKNSSDTFLCPMKKQLFVHDRLRLDPAQLVQHSSQLFQQSHRHQNCPVQPLHSPVVSEQCSFVIPASFAKAYRWRASSFKYPKIHCFISPVVVIVFQTFFYSLFSFFSESSMSAISPGRYVIDRRSGK